MGTSGQQRLGPRQRGGRTAVTGARGAEDLLGLGEGSGTDQCRHGGDGGPGTGPTGQPPVELGAAGEQPAVREHGRRDLDRADEPFGSGARPVAENLVRSGHGGVEVATEQGRLGAPVGQLQRRRPRLDGGVVQLVGARSTAEEGVVGRPFQHGGDLPAVQAGAHQAVREVRDVAAELEAHRGDPTVKGGAVRHATPAQHREPDQRGERPVVEQQPGRDPVVHQRGRGVRRHVQHRGEHRRVHRGPERPAQDQSPQVHGLRVDVGPDLPQHRTRHPERPRLGRRAPPVRSVWSRRGDPLQGRRAGP